MNQVSNGFSSVFKDSSVPSFANHDDKFKMQNNDDENLATVESQLRSQVNQLSNPSILQKTNIELSTLSTTENKALTYEFSVDKDHGTTRNDRLGSFK